MLQPGRLFPRLAVLVLFLLTPAFFESALSAQTLLYDQSGPPSGNGIPDQDFETELDEFDSQAADDFEVSWEHGWDLSLIRTVGTTDGNSNGKVNVRIYANSPGGGRDDLPGAEVCSYDQLSTATFPNLEIALPTPCHLPLGRFWLSVQVDQNYAEFGQHFWSNTRVRNGNEGVWSNPLNGFERNCRNFKPQTMCLVGGANNPDLVFQLLGERTPPPTTDLVLELAGDLPPSSIFARYDLQLTNHGPLDASGVVIAQNLPEGCVFERDSCSGNSTEGWRWELGQLAKDATVACQLICDVASLPAGQQLLATATVTADQPITNMATTSAQVELVTGPLPTVPAAGPAGLAGLAGLLAIAGSLLLRRS